MATLGKALLGHSALWNGSAQFLIDALQLGGDARDHISRYLGYGDADVARVLSCTDSRATVIAASEISDGEGHVYSLPLPPSLSGKTGNRRVIVTLAWFTPINPLNRDYRKAALWFQAPDSPLSADRSSSNFRTVQRGTLQHEVFEGDDAVGYIDGAMLRVKVNCRADAGRLIEAIPYALAVTLETAEELNVRVYEEIRDRLRIVVPVNPHTA